FTQKLTGAVFVVNGYFHLADANSVPSSGGQLAYKLTGRTTLKETALYGPAQSDTSLEFWRFLSDSIAEWKTDQITIAFEYQAGTEKLALPANRRALWMGAQLPVHWTFTRHWSATVRPEMYWDRAGVPAHTCNATQSLKIPAVASCANSPSERKALTRRILNVIIREDEVVRRQGRSGFSLASAQARLASWPLCSPRRSARLTRPDSPPLRKTHLSVRGWRGTSGVVADIHGGWQEARRAYPGGMGGADPSSGRAGTRVQGRRG